MNKLATFVIATLAAASALAHSSKTLDPGRAPLKEAPLGGAPSAPSRVEIYSRSIIPDKVKHGPAMATFEIRNLANVPRDVTFSLGTRNYYRGPESREAKKRITLAPSATATATFQIPNVSAGYRFRKSGSCDLSLIEGQGSSENVIMFRDAEEFLYSGSFSSYPDTVYNVLTCGAVDTISTVADYEREDEADKKKGVSPTTSMEFYTLGTDSELWRGDWRVYAPYDAVVLTPSEWAAIPAAARRALVGYVAHGGTMLLCGADALPAEAEGFRTTAAGGGRTIGVGFGEVRLLAAIGNDRRIPLKRKELEGILKASGDRLGAMTGDTADCGDAERALGLEVLPGPPVGFVTTVLLVFALVVVPAVIIVCARKKRRIASLVVLPLVSFAIAVVAVVGILVNYGVTPSLLQESYAVLDQAGRRAAVHSLAVVFSPKDESDATGFPRTAAVTLLGHDDCRAATFVEGETLRVKSDWMKVLVPSVCAVADVCDTTARLEVRETAPGRLRVTNLFGAPAERIVLYDAAGAAYEAKDLAPGATAELSAAGADPLEGRRRFGFPAARSAAQCDFTAARRGYVATLRGMPFAPDILGGDTAHRHQRTVVVGHYGREAE